jgi:hypothetical protein
MEDGWNLLRILSIIGFGYVLCWTFSFCYHNATAHYSTTTQQQLTRQWSTVTVGGLRSRWIKRGMTSLDSFCVPSHFIKSRHGHPLSVFNKRNSRTLFITLLIKERHVSEYLTYLNFRRAPLNKDKESMSQLIN